MSEHDTLRRATVDGVAVNLISQLARFALRFGYQIVIARLLLPGDFGLVALTGPVMSFIQLFADLGLSQATVQQKEITQPQLSFLFWVNVAAASLLAVICVLIAPLVARFYGDPRVTLVMIASGALMLIGGFYAQHMALLNRNMRFRALALLELGCFALGSAVGIASALLGAGYWSLLINQAAVSLLGLTGAWALTRWVPGQPGPFSLMRPLLHFGGNITGFNIVNFFSRNSDNILIGRFDGEQALGLYDRAFKLMLLPFSQISAPFSKVAIPLLSRCQENAALYRSAYRRMLQTVLLLVYPGLVFMIAYSHQLIVFGLGQRWAGVAPIFSILGLDAFVAPIGNSMGWLFVSQGRTREMRNWGIRTAFLFVGCFVVGLHWGPQGVAGGYAFAGLVEIVLLARSVTAAGPLRGEDFWPLLVPFILAAVLSGVAVTSLRNLLSPGLGSLAVAPILAYASFIAALALLPEGRRMLIEVTAECRRALPAPFVLLRVPRPKPQPSA